MIKSHPGGCGSYVARLAAPNLRCYIAEQQKKSSSAGTPLSLLIDINIPVEVL